MCIDINMHGKHRAYNHKHGDSGSSGSAAGKRGKTIPHPTPPFKKYHKINFHAATLAPPKAIHPDILPTIEPLFGGVTLKDVCDGKCTNNEDFTPSTKSGPEESRCLHSGVQ